MVVLAGWLLRYDIARRTIRHTGLTRFIAVCLLSGYGWLGVGGALTWSFAGIMAGPYYDAMLHTVFVGFVFAMIFGHAPIIVPAILGRTPSPYHPALYGPLALLHASLLLRVTGDLLLVVRPPVGGLAQCPGCAPLREHPGLGVAAQGAQYFHRNLR